MIDAILAISLQARQICVTSLDQSQIYTCYPVAIGKDVTPTPKGLFNTTQLVSQPKYISCQTDINHGAGFLGDYAIVTDMDTAIPNCKLAIHGTNTRQEAVRNGDKVSGGCINLLNKDITHIVNNFYIHGGTINY